MIKNYYRFNESTSEININDRVIVHGKIIGDGYSYVVIEGQTGRVIQKSKRGDYFLILFDNYPPAPLMDMGAEYISRTANITVKQLEKIDSDQKKNEIFFSEQARSVIRYIEYMDCPFENVNVNYIDLTDKNDTISFLDNKRFDRVKTGEDVFNNNLRQEMRIGRFLQMINPYTNKKSLDEKINAFKSTYNGIISQDSKFEVVSGEEIVKWYNESTYVQGNGSLNKSCMRHDNCEDKLYSMYAYNSKIVEMLILVNKENKLEGRALIWTVHDPDIIYMDRIYTVYQENVNRFLEYAKNRGYKNYNHGYDDQMRIFFERDLGSSSENPYMDTFRYFFNEGYYGMNYLTNMVDGNDEEAYYSEYTDT